MKSQLFHTRQVTDTLQGIPAQAIILDDVVEQTYGLDPRSLRRAFKFHPARFLGGLGPAILQKIEQCKDTIPVITGFFGAMPESLIGSVGRGYSDLCGALCAAALHADEFQIWKEVEGIFTADPRKVKSARLLATVTSEEAAELTYYGSEASKDVRADSGASADSSQVIHPLTIEQLDASAIPLRLKNVMNPSGAGTIIYPSRRSTSPSDNGTHDSSMGLEPLDLDGVTTTQSVMMKTNGYHGDTNYRRTPTAVTVKDSIAILNVRSNGTQRPHSFLAGVSKVLESHDIAIDLISSTQQTISLAVCCTESERLSEASLELSELGYVSVMEDMSIVSVVGHKMRNMVGISAEIFGALAGARINIYLISQGASEINIS